MVITNYCETIKLELASLLKSFRIWILECFTNFENSMYQLLHTKAAYFDTQMNDYQNLNCKINYHNINSL